MKQQDKIWYYVYQTSEDSLPEALIVGNMNIHEIQEKIGSVNGYGVEAISKEAAIEEALRNGFTYKPIGHLLSQVQKLSIQVEQFLNTLPE